MAADAPAVLVVGSANLDVVLSVGTLPAAGETVLAHARTPGPGGKGANQAAAAARSGTRTAFLGAVGDDEGGRLLRAELAAAGVDLALLRVVPAPTGTAYVVVDAAGENAIVVDPGANAALVALTATELAQAAGAQVVLCQLEVAPQTVADALRAADGLRVLNAAPARPLPPGLLSLVDVLVVNEQEALAVAAALGGGASTVDGAVARLLAEVPEVVVTLGAAGALLGRRGVRPLHVPGVPARVVVDTTGAGDTFCGVLVAARAAGADPEQAVLRGCAAASLSVERPGAARAAPGPEQVRARLAELDRAGHG